VDLPPKHSLKQDELEVDPPARFLGVTSIPIDSDCFHYWTDDSLGQFLKFIGIPSPT
jgi:hypothetical protein